MAATGKDGFSLVELLVGMLLLAIVFCGWLSMNNIQQVSREALRYAAVEEAAGMLDALSSLPGGGRAEGGYRITPAGIPERLPHEDDRGGVILPLGDGPDALGYCLEIYDGDLPESDVNWRWARVWLFDRCDMTAGVDEPFADFRVLLGPGKKGAAN